MLGTDFFENAGANFLGGLGVVFLVGLLVMFRSFIIALFTHVRRPVPFGRRECLILCMGCWGINLLFCLAIFSPLFAPHIDQDPQPRLGWLAIALAVFFGALYYFGIVTNTDGTPAVWKEGSTISVLSTAASFGAFAYCECINPSFVSNHVGGIVAIPILILQFIVAGLLLARYINDVRAAVIAPIPWGISEQYAMLTGILIFGTILLSIICYLKVPEYGGKWLGWICIPLLAYICSVFPTKVWRRTRQLVGFEKASGYVLFVSLIAFLTTSIITAICMIAGRIPLPHPW